MEKTAFCSTKPSRKSLKKVYLPGVVVHSCNPSTWEAEAGDLRGYPVPLGENLAQKTKRRKPKGFSG
jgi:hypothetical protein